MISAFDIYKIGIGPSSSHTVGPMKAGAAFLSELVEKNLLEQTARIQVDVYGSLSLTGRGHHTDLAVILGLEGYLPETVPLEEIASIIKRVEQDERIDLGRRHEAAFLRASGLVFHAEFLPKHENGMKISAWDDAGRLLYSNTYYSIGGGFIVDDEHFGLEPQAEKPVPYPYKNAAELLAACERTGLSISSLAMENELVFHTREEIYAHFARIREVMEEAIARGIHTEGLLPGPLRVQRRAPSLNRALESTARLSVDPMAVLDWINMFALAVSEENAHQRSLRRDSGSACVLGEVYRRAQARTLPALLSGFSCNRRALQKKRLHFRCRSGLPRGSGGCLFDGGSRSCRSDGRFALASGNGCRNRHGAFAGAHL